MGIQNEQPKRTIENDHLFNIYGQLETFDELIERYSPEFNDFAQRAAQDSLLQNRNAYDGHPGAVEPLDASNAEDTQTQSIDHSQNE